MRPGGTRGSLGAPAQPPRYEDEPQGPAEANSAGYGATEQAAPASLGDAAAEAQRLFGSKQEARAVAKALAMMAFAGAKAELKVSVTDLPALMMPWALFTMCLLPVALMPEVFLGYLSLLLCVPLGMGFLLLSRGRAWRMLALTCLVALALGEFLGLYDRYKYLYPFHVYWRSPYRTNVLPSDRPDAYRDAGYLEFSTDSHVDGSRGLGYTSRELWCVAPIVGAEQPTSAGFATMPVGFWAVGQNCCQRRGLFHCGDIRSPQKHGGLVVIDASGLEEPLIPTYTLAAQAASQTYGLMLPEQPIFVRWAEEPGDALGEMYLEATGFCWMAVLVFLGIVPVLALVLGCLGLALTDRKETPHWHPEKVAVMRFGLDCMPRRHERGLELDLLRNRCYWSGEVIYDYAFHIANTHMFGGCLFCHPVHPYSKWERFIVMVIVCLFIVFPVAAFSVKWGQTGITRTILVAGLVTLPRNLLKLYLIQIAQEDTVLELEEGHRKGSPAPRHALLWEVAFLAGCLCGALVTAAICTSYIHSATARPISEVLLRNCDGLGFAFVLEPLFDLVSPFVAMGTGECEGIWAWGFFGRWCMERDAHEEEERAKEAAVSPPGTERQLEANRGLRPLAFRGLGAEILLGGEAQHQGRKPKRSS